MDGWMDGKGTASPKKGPRRRQKVLEQMMPIKPCMHAKHATYVPPDSANLDGKYQTISFGAAAAITFLAGAYPQYAPKPSRLWNDWIGCGCIVFPLAWLAGMYPGARKEAIEVSPPGRDETKGLLFHFFMQWRRLRLIGCDRGMHQIGCLLGATVRTAVNAAGNATRYAIHARKYI